jgi:hypothetical protein
MTNNSFELQVLVGGHSIREYGYQGKTYVEGRRGQNFTLKFRNNACNRVLIVPSIDGICTVDGKPATAQSRGYVVAGYSTTEIKGWKTSLEDTAEFIFTDKGRSYAGQVASDVNSGAIGVLVLAEKTKPVSFYYQPLPEHHHHYHYHHYYPPPVYIAPTPVWPSWPGYPIITCSTGETRYGSSAGAQAVCVNMCSTAVENSTGAVAGVETPDFNLGTGFGKQISDHVSEVEFERGCQLALMEIFYSDEPGLLKAGVQLKKEVIVSKPFPQSFGGFCSTPKIVESGH